MNSIPTTLELLASLPEYHPQATPTDRLKWSDARGEAPLAAKTAPVDLTTIPQTIDYSTISLDNQDVCNAVTGLAVATLTTLPPESFIVVGSLTGTVAGAAIGVAAAGISDAMHKNPGLAEVTEIQFNEACAVAFGAGESPTNLAVRLVEAAAYSIIPEPGADVIPDQPNPDVPLSIDGNPTSYDGEPASTGLEPADGSIDSSSDPDPTGLGNTDASDDYDVPEIDYDPGGMCEDPGSSDIPGWGDGGFPDVDHSDRPSCEVDDSSAGSSSDDFGPGTSGFDDDYSGGGGSGSGGGASGQFNDRFDESSRIDHDRSNCSGCDGDDDSGGG
ncbi:hypothetical protein [Agrobacterium tumefaciens]|uniref:hypothetical protein n=1 Tax=Agrobacterium tumefaciens TaxID=358 RepID=UPI003B9FF41F